MWTTGWPIRPPDPYIEEACPGDMVLVEILDIDLDQVGILDKGPTGGALKGHFPEYVIRRLPVKDGTILYGELEIPVRPMVGVIGTAPRRGEESTLTAKDHGGNMDCTSIAPGAVLYLPVNVPGALLAMGDLHAIMGDGECGNCGVEIGGRVTVRVDVLKSPDLPWPLVELADRWIVISSGETVSVMLNEEDHLRIQGLLPGMQLERSAELAFNADDALGAQNVYAFDPQWGYLTSCPTNVGTGMRASAMLHLPAITQNGQIGAIMQAVAKLGLTVRGLYGEGSEAQGDLYQLSNQVTLGRSEEDVIRSLQAAKSHMHTKPSRK